MEISKISPQNMVTLGHFFKKIFCLGPKPLLGRGGGGGGSPNCENLPQKNVGMVVAKKWLGVRGTFALMLGNLELSPNF
jgi:hypothetical protein